MHKSPLIKYKTRQRQCRWRCQRRVSSLNDTYKYTRQNVTWLCTWFVDFHSTDWPAATKLISTKTLISHLLQQNFIRNLNISMDRKKILSTCDYENADAAALIASSTTGLHIFIFYFSLPSSPNTYLFILFFSVTRGFPDDERKIRHC